MKDLTRRFKQYLVTGFIIIAPVSITLFLLVSFVQIVDIMMAPLAYAVFGRSIPGVGLAAAFLLMLVAGALGSNISGRHVLESVEDLLLHIPVFNWLYRTVKQLTEVFSPGSRMQFQSVVLIEYPRPGVYSVGFVTKKVRATMPDGREQTLFCVYVATNHVYIGDLVLVPEDKVLYTPLNMQEGIQAFLSAGATVPARLRVSAREIPRAAPPVAPPSAPPASQ